MKVRAAIFDVYGTLLRVGPPPADAALRWHGLFQDFFHSAPRLTPLEFTVACQKAIATRHTAARALGIAFPEILWPEIVGEVLPECARLKPAGREEFVYRHIQTGHTTELFPEAAGVLRELVRQGCALGIASNAQAYTLRELAEALAAHNLGLDVFERDLCFWSFEHGFSKPDPHVFHIFSTRLAGRGIRPGETLIVGDRLDNDIEPGRAQGWQTWHLTSTASDATPFAGNWRKLLASLNAVCPGRESDHRVSVPSGYSGTVPR